MSYKTDNFFVIAEDRLAFLTWFEDKNSHKMQKFFPLVHHDKMHFELLEDHLIGADAISNDNPEYF